MTKEHTPDPIEYLKEAVFNQENRIGDIACKTPEDMTPREWMENELTLWYECGRVSALRQVLDHFEQSVEFMTEDEFSAYIRRLGDVAKNMKDPETTSDML